MEGRIPKDLQKRKDKNAIFVFYKFSEKCFNIFANAMIVLFCFVVFTFHEGINNWKDVLISK